MAVGERLPGTSTRFADHKEWNAASVGRRLDEALDRLARVTLGRPRAHAADHEPGARDPLICGAPLPLALGNAATTPGEGTATTLSRSDHDHGDIKREITVRDSSGVVGTRGAVEFDEDQFAVDDVPGLDKVTVELNPLVAVYFNDVAIGNAALKTLNAVPVELVEAPGAGYGLIFEGALIEYVYVTAAFDGTAPDRELMIGYAGTPVTPVVGRAESVGFLNQVADARRWVYPMSNTAAAGFTTEVDPPENTGLSLQIDVAEVYAAAGGGSLRVRTYYRVIPMTLA